MSEKTAKMTVEVAVIKSGRKHEIHVLRPMAAGQIGHYMSHAKAMEKAGEAAMLLALGLGLRAMRGEVEPSPVDADGWPQVARPRTHELVEAAKAAVKSTAKLFGHLKSGEDA